MITEFARGMGKVEILKQISAPTGLLTPDLLVDSPAYYTNSNLTVSALKFHPLTERTERMNKILSILRQVTHPTRQDCGTMEIFLTHG